MDGRIPEKPAATATGRRIRPLPETAAELDALAQALAASAAEALAIGNAILIAVIAPAGEPGQSAPMVVHYDRGFLPREVNIPAVAKAGAALLSELRSRWPSYAPAPEMGLITDGTGVGFAPDALSPRAPDWFIRQVTSPTPLTELAPFAANGAWRQLTCLPLSYLIH